MRLRQLLYGAATFVPGVSRLRAKGTGGTDSARYCYSVWLRHLVMAANNGLNPHPNVVAELGPGDSLGIGLAALLSGCTRYFAFDVLEHADARRNLAVFRELVTLFSERSPIPDEAEFPDVRPCLPDYAFPAAILDEARLQRALEGQRIERIIASITDPRRDGGVIQYRVPWHASNTLESGTVNMIYSQAVLEHVDDVRGTYKAMYAWLDSAGYISHQIDFRCHGSAADWNGHWAYSDLTWRLIRGRRAYLLNREPHSTHIAAMAAEGFEVVCDQRGRTASDLTTDELAPRFRSLSADDLTTSDAFIQAVKRRESSV